MATSEAALTGTEENPAGKKNPNFFLLAPDPEMEAGPEEWTQGLCVGASTGRPLASQPAIL